MTRRKLALAVTMILLAGSAEALPATAKPFQPPRAQTEAAVAGSSLVPKPVRTEWDPPASAPAEPVWPARLSVEVAMPSRSHRQLGMDGPVQVPGLPMRIEAGVGERVHVESPGGPSLRWRLSGRQTTAHVSIDYTGFQSAYGADWATRLALYQIPACGGCPWVRIDSVNDGRSITGAIPVTEKTFVPAIQRGLLPDAENTAPEQMGGTLIAIAAANSGPGGDYKATSLSPSATWSAGDNTGEFAWNYPLRMPPPVGGPSPTIELAYSSSSVDGRMASTNNQASWIGEGFEWSPGYIERRYSSCADDKGPGASNTEDTGDLCWETDNASLSMSGHAGELIKDGSNANRWHLRSDDGTFVEHKTGASNGDNDGEWWLVTTTDGTQYWFGGRPGSNSTLNVRVFGNHDDEPCEVGEFEVSHCNQGYKWFLDHVVDRHGNTMSYKYIKETNKYGMNNEPENDMVYDRDGYLEKIEYGTRTGSTGNAPMQVLFTVGDRCFTACTVNANWQDVPLDQECTKDTCEYYQNGPTFWTKRRLSTIKTQVWGGSSYRDVELWTFSHSFPSSDQPALWLNKIAHTGLVGGSKTVPDITFAGVAMPNRVDTNNDQYPAMHRYRMKTITSETGGKLDLLYKPQDCFKGSRMPNKGALQDNVLRCYPVKWKPEGNTTEIVDFFHKYLIGEVLEADLGGSSSRVITKYDYVGNPAWHYTDDDGFIKKDYKTWSVWRGYGTVQTTSGDPGEQTREERRYFRGMHGDKLPSGSRNVQLPAIAIGNVPAVNDEDAFAGMVRETITYNGPGGAEISAKATQPWQSAPTASRTVNGQTVHARFTGEAAAHTRVALDRGRGFRTTTRTTVFDSLGMPSREEDRGDDDKSGDEQCTLTDYVRNADLGILDRVSRVRTFAVDCAAAQAGGLTAAKVIGDTKTSYDGLAWNTAPQRGLATKTEVLAAYNGGPAYVTEATKKYDLQGRVTEETDQRGGLTKTSYTPASGGPLTASTKTSPLSWTKSSVLEPAWGVPTSTTDTNGRVISLAYDPFGRLTSVWLAGRDKGTQSASIIYDYLIRNNAPTVVTTKRLNATGGYITSYQFYDNLFRSRQTQEPDGAGGTAAVVTDTYYDSAGRAYKTHEPYLAKNASDQPVPPSINLFQPLGNIPSLAVKEFDGSGRVTAEITKVNGPPASPGGTEKWRTTTVYGGDRTDVTPPAGGTATSTITNTVGKTIQLRHYHAGVAAGSDTGFDKTDYGYNNKGQLESVTDAGGNAWRYEYDMRGRQTKSIDPDKGTTTTVFNDAGDILSTTDGRGQTLAYTYDVIGRKSTLREGSATGPKRSEWVYDLLSNLTPVKGHLVKTIRYEGSEQYIKEHLGYTVDYKPTSVKYTVPNSTSAAGLNGSYTYVYTYHQDGSLYTTRLPALGDLGLETLTHGYNTLGKPTTLQTSLGESLVVGTDYTSFNELGALHLQHNGFTRADVVRTYDTATRRLAQIWTTRGTTPTTVADVRYSYDAIGNVTKVSDLTAADHQCFTTDYMRQLTQAWTPSSGDCSAAPSTAGLGGPAKYWHTYTFDAVGNRKKLVEHASTGDVSTDYSVTGHRLNSAGAGSYTYDLSGNMLSRPAPGGGAQTMTWDAEGHLATSTDSTGTTTFIYDVDGTRLLRKDPAGKTLYLPGQELRYTAAGGAKTCTRYYTHAEQVVGTRTAAGVVWLSGDHHGTAQISITSASQAVAIRRESPYGLVRGTSGTWPAAMDKGFVGGTVDKTGLTHLGAREYDPKIGRFISVDPVIDIKDPQQMHGYTYSGNAPITASDPDGQWPKWADKAVNKVASAASTAANAVGSATKSAGNFVYDHAGTISTVLTVAAIACAIIPPLQAAAPFLGAAAAAVGAIETFKSCKSGAGLDCALGVAELVPGGRAVGAVGKGVKYADEAADLAKANKATKGKPAGPAALDKPGCHSFEPKTPVVMADGTRKPIAAVKVGEQVLATDPQTGQTGPQEVTTLHENLDRDLTDLTVAASGQSKVVKTTWNHPFWSVTRAAWVDAAALLPGESLRQPDGSLVTVQAVDNYVGEQTMRDLTVANAHTYYVGVGDSALLVHNDPPTACPIPGHDTGTIEFNTYQPPGCTCTPTWIDLGPNKTRPGGGRRSESDPSDVDAEIVEQRDRNEAAANALDAAKNHVDDHPGVALGLIAAAGMAKAKQKVAEYKKKFDKWRYMRNKNMW